MCLCYARQSMLCIMLSTLGALLLLLYVVPHGRGDCAFQPPLSRHPPCSMPTLIPVACPS